MPIEKEILNMLDLGRKPFQLFFYIEIGKDRKDPDKCTHRSTNPFDASIFTIARLPSLCGYTLLI